MEAPPFFILAIPIYLEGQSTLMQMKCKDYN